MTNPKTNRITVFKAKDFRRWLEKNHNKENQVELLVYKKHTGKSFPTHRELIEEAICFGWIDTTIKRLDEDTYIRRFARRTKNSTWSNNTLRYAKNLKKQGKMTEAGLKYYELGRKKPTHDQSIPKNPSMPAELKAALTKNKKAKENFEKFPPSTKKMLYRWFLSAKLPVTKNKRIDKIVKMAKDGNKKLY